MIVISSMDLQKKTFRLNQDSTPTPQMKEKQLCKLYYVCVDQQIQTAYEEQLG
jgi:hypothetical protein